MCSANNDPSNPQALINKMMPGEAFRYRAPAFMQEIWRDVGDAACVQHFTHNGKGCFRTNRQYAEVSEPGFIDAITPTHRDPATSRPHHPTIPLTHLRLPHYSVMDYRGV